MLEIIAIVLIVLWLLGLVSSNSMSEFIHITGHSHHRDIGPRHPRLGVMLSSAFFRKLPKLTPTKRR